MKTQLMEQSDVSCLSEFDPPPLFDMYYIYLLQSRKDKGLYIGYTNDLKRRFAEHNKGLCISTKSRRPFRLVYYEGYSLETDVRIRERRLKQFKNANRELLRRISNCLEK